jgi:deoxyribodipyrimidine photo-lyase
MKKALFIFRRDLRLHDNTGLIYALKNYDQVIPCFIFTPEQIKKNPYLSKRCLQFMLESLKDLNDQLQTKNGKLYLFWGSFDTIVQKCIKDLNLDAVVVNKDYTPFSQKRDQKIAQVCQNLDVSFHSFEDVLLHPIDMTLKKNHEPYTIFTPYYRHASLISVEKCQSNHHTNYYSKKISFEQSFSIFKKILPVRVLQQKGGRKEGLKILKNISRFSQYKKLRDFPIKDATTHLSPHMKFTTLSPREVYFALAKEFSKKSDLVRSLYWRDFFTMIVYYFPQVFKGAFKQKFNNISWKNNRAFFQKWCLGKTGCPIVDAGMREMNETGYMHNRVRMIAASYLVKDLHIDWRMGEKYFAQKLIDYDPAVNNGNWQWVASTGADSQPYFRIFNPFTQAQKFDPECLYIKKWIQELKDFSCREIHAWDQKKTSDKKNRYPSPIVEHVLEARKAYEIYKKAL